MQAQAHAAQLAADRAAFVEEKAALAGELCRLEIQINNCQLVARSRAQREASHAVKVQQLQVLLDCWIGCQPLLPCPALGFRSGGSHRLQTAETAQQPRCIVAGCDRFKRGHAGH